MNKYIIIIMLMLTTIVIADHDLNYDTYMEVNATERIYINDGDTIQDQTATLFVDGVTTIFNKINNNQTFELFITNEKEEDLNYLIEIYNSTSVLKEFNNSDGILNNYITIKDNRLYGFKKTETSNHTIGETEYHDVCPYILNNLGNPRITSYVTYKKPLTNNYSFTSKSDSLNIINTDYNYICQKLTQIYEDNVSSYEELYLFQCDNCDNTNKLRLGIDTTAIFGKSVILNNKINQTQTNVTTSNYMMRVFEIDDEPIERYSDIFKFRIPFYLNIAIIDNYNTSFNPIFNYIYLKEKGLINNQKYADIGTSISSILTLGFTTKNIVYDYQTALWTKLDLNSQGQIKMYEKGNYTVTMLSMKTFNDDGWSYEFYKPQYSESKVETTLDLNLEINEEINQSVNIQASEYELNKSGFIFNIGKWVLLIIISLIGIGASFYTPNPMVAIGVLLTVILPIMYKVLF